MPFRMVLGLSAKRPVCIVEPLLEEQQDLTDLFPLPTLPPAAAGSAGHLLQFIIS